ncbi:hypothetical protein Ga0102493_11960 [Erythrobacter litoralis]|uniref:Lipoprotein n=1 Tax=Erythrobacter litoralis TaxID=39960 RepID=A0A074MT17_9SPHN|nr:hypothetical protein [Erythrobacter litoralis]AOL21989.1 hypothetical protein Ga0102493_11960 [Erythrobacter litoralis]KEO96609.1 hypothetical protein EH32_10300 [Erythrobacter litoralis]
MRASLSLAALLALPLLSGCLARAAVDVVTFPVRAAGEVVDVATTSQSERDEKRGRELRKREERLGKLERDYDDEIADCEKGDERACEKARQTWAEMEEIRASLPAPPPDGD